MDFASMAQYAPLFVEGLKVTVQIAFVAVIIGAILGLFVALGRLSTNKVISFIATGYIQIIRGTPVLVQLYIIYYATYPLFGFNIPPYIAAVATFGLNSSAYVAEIIRAGIQAVDFGQMEAGRSLGLPHGMVMRYIIIPQAIKNILPALGNEFVVLLKETSVFSAVALADLMFVAKDLIGMYYKTNEALLVLVIAYLIILLPMSLGITLLERRIRYAGFGR